MEIVKDKDFILDIKNYDVILVGTGIKNVKGNGFQYKIAKNFPYAYRALSNTNFDDANKLGTCLVVTGRKDIPTIVYCFITKGRYRPDLIPDTVNYEALISCLNLVKKNFSDKKIGSTILGVAPFEGGGDKERILDIFKGTCDGLDITLYDYEQMNYRIEDNINYKEMVRRYIDKEISMEEYYKEKSKYLWGRKYGIHSPVPDMCYRKLCALIKDKEALENFFKENKDKYFVF